MLLSRGSIGSNSFLGVGVAIFVGVGFASPLLAWEDDVADAWSPLEPVDSIAPPEGAASARNPIDQFLEVERRARGLEAVGPADKPTLLRRVYLDLIGLPPTIEEQQDFARDASPDAYDKVVDRLLENEQFGVREARRWLDVLRYADEDDRMTASTGMHLWRDWVIHALNLDIPYDDFVQIQLTGRRADERTKMSATGYRSEKEPRPGDLFALGFLARGAGSGENTQNLAMNAVDTISSAFMGMSVACAKCHDHKFDPISMEDYYSMKALFDPLALRKITLATASDLMEAGRLMEEVEQKRAPLQRELTVLLAPYKQRLYDERVEMLPEDVRAIILKPEDERSVQEQKIADDYFPILRIDSGKINEILPEDARRESRELERRIDEAGRLGRRAPRIPAFYTVEVDPIREREKSYVLTSGDPSRPELDKEVSPGWPFHEGDYDFRHGRVEAFADWLTAPENPLFARIAVNRLWQWRFGTGLQKSSSDFGQQAGIPSHPKLLDWLAGEFVRSGYSLKRMIRLIVTSDAYKMDSAPGQNSSANLDADPRNVYLWRFPLRRLEAEPIWDSIHAAAGVLDLEVGGRSFDPDDDDETQRRGVYIRRGFSSSRDVTPGFLQSFDVEDGREPCPRRTETVTAPQALFLMNSPEIDAACSQFERRVNSETGGNLQEAIDVAYRLTLARSPTAFEVSRALAFLDGDSGRLKQLAWLLFNLDEFIYVP